MPKAMSNNIDDVVMPLKEQISKLESFLEIIKLETQNKLIYQAAQISNLQTRISNLEEQTQFMHHLLEINYRRLDDLEQYSRKVNLRLNDIEIFNNDNPLKIMGYIKREVEKLNLDITDKEYDRCHRIGKTYRKNGKTYQPVILRMCSWRTRNDIYVNRKNLPFFVGADLTSERQRMFDWAKKDLKECVSSQKVVSYVFIDDNCKMKMKTASGKYLFFSTWNEYLSLVIRLNKNIPYTDEVVIGDYMDRTYC